MRNQQEAAGPNLYFLLEEIVDALWLSRGSSGREEFRYIGYVLLAMTCADRLEVECLIGAYIGTLVAVTNRCPLLWESFYLSLVLFLKMNTYIRGALHVSLNIRQRILKYSDLYPPPLNSCIISKYETESCPIKKIQV